MPREILRQDRLDFSEWTWGDKAEALLKVLGDEVAATLAASLTECLYARLRYDTVKDQLVICAELQADDSYKHLVEVQHPLIEDVEMTIEHNTVYGGKLPGFGAIWYVHPDDDGESRRMLECMSRTFLELHKKAQGVLDQPEPEEDKAWRAEKKLRDASGP